MSTEDVKEVPEEGSDFENLPPEEQEAIWDAMLPNMTEEEQEEHCMDLEVD
jgi:hypothetical protein